MKTLSAVQSRKIKREWREERKVERRRKSSQRIREEFIEAGFHAVIAVLKTGPNAVAIRQQNSSFVVAIKATGRQAEELVAMAVTKGVLVKETERHSAVQELYSRQTKIGMPIDEEIAEQVKQFLGQEEKR